jgi:hypothetical protein
MRTALRRLWSPPPADLALSSDDVHVWRASLDQPAARKIYPKTSAALKVIRALTFAQVGLQSA